MLADGDEPLKDSLENERTLVMQIGTALTEQQSLSREMSVLQHNGDRKWCEPWHIIAKGAVKTWSGRAVSGQPFLRVLQDRTNGSWVPRGLLPSTSGRLDGISQWLPDLYSADAVQQLLSEWNRRRNWENENTPSYFYIQYYRIPFRLLNSLCKITRMVIKELTSISLGVFVLWWHIYFVMSIRDIERWLVSDLWRWVIMLS